MALLLSGAVFAVLVVAISLVGYRYYVRPGRYYDQLGAFSTLADRVAAKKESLPGRLVRAIGEKVPVSPEEVSMTRRYLIAAGYRSEQAVATYYGIRVLVVAAFFAAGLYLRRYAPYPGLQIVILIFAVLAGLYLPGMVLDMLVSRRQERLRHALPDALDLMVVCVEAGLGLDQAVMKVAQELAITHPELSSELELVTLEMQAGKRRAEALRDLATRTGEPNIRKLVAVMIQTDRFGTSMADSLRTHSEYLRIKRRQEAEERANKVGVKLVFPIFFCILPAMFVVVAGPGVLQLVKQLFPLMRQFTQARGF